jgi:hypothetical protein
MDGGNPTCTDICQAIGIDRYQAMYSNLSHAYTPGSGYVQKLYSTTELKNMPMLL